METTETVLSIFYKNGSIGGAHYDSSIGHLSLIQDIHTSEDPSVYILDYLLNIRHTDILICNDLIPNLDPIRENSDLRIRTIPSKDIDLHECKRRILDINIETTQNDKYRQLYIKSIVDFDLACSVKSLGTLLMFTPSIDIIHLEALSFSNILQINKRTLDSLKILTYSERPSASRFGAWNHGNAKSSIYGLISKYLSGSGIGYLKDFMLCPSRNVDQVLENQRTIEFFSTLHNDDDIFKKIRCSLKRIKCMLGILKRSKNMNLSLKDWNVLKKNFKELISLHHYLNSLRRNNCLIFQNILSITSEPLIIKLFEFVTVLYDEASSKEKQRFSLNSGVCQEFDRKVRFQNGIPDLLSKIAEAEAEEIAPTQDPNVECSVVYFPSLGYMTVLNKSDNLAVRRNHPDCELLFAADDQVHFKTRRCRELDGLLGNIDTDIKQIELNAMINLCKLITHLSEKLKTLSYWIGKLDCLVALSILAKQKGWIKPIVLTDYTLSSLQIENARHPLQEFYFAQYLSDTINMENKRICVVTGNHGSGKSSYLKLIGVCVYLAHLGSYIPATKAIIPLAERIEMRIPASESISLGFSSFSLDVYQIFKSLSLNSGTLLLIDEFGQGTKDGNASALLESCITHFLSEERVSPLIFISTSDINRLKINSNYIQYKKLRNSLTQTQIEDDREQNLIDCYMGEAQSSRVKFLETFFYGNPSSNDIESFISINSNHDEFYEKLISMTKEEFCESLPLIKTYLMTEV